MLLLTYWYCILLWRDRGVLAHLQELCPESIYAREIKESIIAESNYTNHEVSVTLPLATCCPSQYDKRCLQ
jgi:hypothetical protein